MSNMYMTYKTFQAAATLAHVGLKEYDKYQSQLESESQTQELLGGPYDYQGPAQAANVLANLEAANPAAQMAQQVLDEAADPSRTPSFVEEPPEAFPGVTSDDESQGGSNIEDPEAAAAAAAGAEDEEPDEVLVVTAQRAKRDIRPFQDQDFILMHAYNLVQLRNEKMNFDLDEVPPDKLEDVDGDKKGDDVALNTIRAIKGALPYAYLSTPSHPKEVNAAIQCIGDPAGFTNYLKATPNLQRHLDLTTEDLSNLTTKIRLYKLFQREERPSIVEFVFETSGIGSSELEEMIKSKGKKRGYGVGIKSFNFVNQSKFIHLIDRQVHAELVIYADSLDSLLKTRIGYSSDPDFNHQLEYRFTDLALRNRRAPGTISGGRLGSVSDLTFQVIVEVGVTKSASSIPGLSDDSSTMLMKLNPKTHNLSFNIDGSVELKIEYNGVIETIFAEPVHFDIFKNYKNLVNEYATQFAAIGYQNRCGGKDTQKIKTALSSITNENKSKRMRMLNDGLRDRGKIYYINIQPDVLKAWNSLFNDKSPNQTGEPLKDALLNEQHRTSALKVLQSALGAKVPTASDDEQNSSSLSSNISSVDTNQKQAQEMQNDMEEKQPPQSALRDCAIDPNSNQIAFFYASDLINLILENISDTYSLTEIDRATTEALDIVGGVADIDPQDKLGSAFQSAVQVSLGRGPDDAGEQIDNKSFKEMLDFKEKQVASLEHFKKLRIVLGPMYIEDYFSMTTGLCSIGDIPISLRHFNEWLSGEMDKRTRYSLNDFLIDFIKKYLPTYLKGNPELNDKALLGKDYLFGNQGFLGYGNKFKEEGLDTDPLTLMRRTHSKAAGRKSLQYELIENEYRPLINLHSNIISAERKKDAYDYLVFYQSDAHFSILPQIGTYQRIATRFYKDPAQNQLSKKGIGAYFHGRDRGIVKDIQYAKTDAPGLKSALAAEAGLNNLDGLEQFREVFSAKLTTFANFEVSPGDYVFIDPESINSYLSKETRDSLGTAGTQFIGVGGFFTVRAVSHFFEQGKFETSIDTIFTKSANAQYSMFELGKQKEEEEKQNNEINKEEQDKIRKGCKSSLQQVESTENATLARAKDSASSIVGDFAEFAEALFKAIFDNSDSEISDNDLSSVVGNSETSTGSSPDQGNENVANNGPVT